MEKLKQPADEGIIETDEFFKDDFNAESYFDVKEENLHAYPNLLMDQAIEAMTRHLQ